MTNLHDAKDAVCHSPGVVIQVDKSGLRPLGTPERTGMRLAESAESSILLLGHPVISSSASQFWLSVEDVLGLWSDHGSALVESIDGSFALLCLERREGKLNVFTDRFGTINLFYHSSGNGGLLISDSLSLLSSRIDNPAPHDDAIQDVLLFGFVLGDATPVRNVKKFDCARHYQIPLAIPSQGMSVDRYWRVPASSHSSQSLHEVVDRVAARFTDNLVRSVSLEQARASLPLTSGKDSRAILSALHDRTPLHCYTHGSPSSPDVRIAARCARRIGAEHDVYELEGDWVGSIMESARRHVDTLNGMIDGIRFLHVLTSIDREAQIDSRNYFAGGLANEVWEGKFLTGEFLKAQCEEDAADAALRVLERARSANYDMLDDSREAVRRRLLDRLTGIVAGAGSDWRRDPVAASIDLVQHTYASCFFSHFSSHLSRRFRLFNPFLEEKLVSFLPGVHVELLKRGDLQRLIVGKNCPELAREPFYNEGTYTYCPLGRLNAYRNTAQALFRGTKRTLNSLGRATLGRPVFDYKYFVDYPRWLHDVHKEEILDILTSQDLRPQSVLNRGRLSRMLDAFSRGELSRVDPLTRVVSLDLWWRKLASKPRSA